MYTLKINVHKNYFRVQLPNDNSTDLGVVYSNSSCLLKNPSIIMFNGLRHAFHEGYCDVILKMTITKLST